MPWTELLNELQMGKQINKLNYSVPIYIGKIKSRRTKGEGHVVCMEKMRNTFRKLVGKCEKRNS
jgi:hypothetical protein